MKADANVLVALGVLCCSVSCAEATPTAPAPRYPAVAREAAQNVTVRLSLDEGALPLTLPCAQKESAEPNGIDDDCNGRIDEGDPASVLSIAITHDPRQELRIELRTADGQTITPAAHAELGTCDATSAVAIESASFTSLAPGAYQVVIARGTRCVAEDVLLAHVSFAVVKAPPTRFGRVLNVAEPTQVATVVVP